MTMSDRHLTHLSLFSGIGGLDLAAEWAGFTTVGQCEWADYPRKVLERHWPGLPRWRDIRTLTGDDFYERTGLRTVDVISGGFPCQPFSLAGKRRGMEDDRYLWPEMLRVISEIRPAWVVGENVAGLVSMVKSVSGFRVESRSVNRLPDADYYEAVLSRQEDALLDSLLGDLEHIGYDVQALVIPACAVGAPHRRDRIALVAYSDRFGLSSERSKQQTAGAARSGENVANTDGGTMRHDSDDRRTTVGEIHASVHPSVSGGTAEIVSDAKGAKRTGFRSAARGWRTEPGCCGWWSTEPDVGRVAHGVPARVDRLKCLGNAVVPQQFYPIFNAIAEVQRQCLR